MPEDSHEMYSYVNNHGNQEMIRVHLVMTNQMFGKREGLREKCNSVIIYKERLYNSTD